MKWASKEKAQRNAISGDVEIYGQLGKSMCIHVRETAKKKMHLCKCVWALLRCSREFQEHSIKAPSLDLNVKHRQALRRCCVSVRVCMVITVLTPFQLTTNSPQEQSLSCQHGNKDLWGCVSTWHLWWAERCKGTLEKESLEGRKWH